MTGRATAICCVFMYHSLYDYRSMGGRRIKWFSLASLLFLLVFVFIFPLGLMAGSYLAEADAIYDHGGIENYRRSIELYLKALEVNPNDYEANWECSIEFQKKPKWKKTYA